MAQPGANLFVTLQEAGITVPHACFHPRLQSHSRCSLCLVELWEDDAWQISHSCHTTVEQPLTIRTDSPRLRQLRGEAAALLLARGPFRNTDFSTKLQTLVDKAAGGEAMLASARKCRADEIGKPKTMAAGCILCGRCVAICHLAGKRRLTFLSRGKNLRVACLPSPEVDGGCGKCRACYKICPTGFIQADDVEEVFQAKLYTV